MKPSSSCSYSELAYERKGPVTHNIRYLSERLPGEELGRLVFAFRKIDGMQLKWHLLFVQDHCDATGARRDWRSVEPEHHLEFRRIRGSYASGSNFEVSFIPGPTR